MDYSIDFAEKPERSLVCLACGSTEPKKHKVGVQATLERLQQYDLYECECGSLCVFPEPHPDYVHHTDEDIKIRDYVELNGGVDIIARTILQAIPPRPTGRMLEVGTGYGFGMDFVRRELGWAVDGFEPSRYGEEGAKALGLPIQRRFLELHEDIGTFDLVFASEVVEHVFDVAGFVQNLASRLNKNGVLALTTPDPKNIVPSTPHSIVLALISPGAHSVLISPEQLTNIFKQTGLVHTKILANGYGYEIVGSASPLEFRDRSSFDPTIASYLSHLVGADVAQSNNSLKWGMTYRAFRNRIDHGDYVGAADFTSLPPIDSSRSATVSTVAEFLALYPSCAGPLEYYRGHFDQHHNRLEHAAEHYFSAFLLCMKKYQVATSIAVTEEDLAWRALVDWLRVKSAASLAIEPRDVALMVRACANNTPSLPQDVGKQIADLLEGTPPRPQWRAHRLFSRRAEQPR